MSKPNFFQEPTTSGITVDPRTLERVIPESKRPDGTVRKQLKIRPGYTPQEDVRRFRGTKQAQMDANTLPKGHIIGWAPPPTSSASKSGGVPGAAAGSGAGPAKSKAAKKNEKRSQKRKEKKDSPEEVRDNWDDDDEDTGSVPGKSTPKGTGSNAKSDATGPAAVSTPGSKATDSKGTSQSTDADDLATELKKLEVS